MAEYSIEPWGGLRDDAMLAQICLILATAFSGKKANFTLDDFMLFSNNGETTSAPKRKQTVKQQQAMAKKLVQYFGQVKHG